MNRYLKIAFMWIFLPTLAGFVLAWLGAGHGGASAIFLIFGFLLGIAGAAIHCEIVALRDNKFNNKIYATLCMLMVFFFIAWLILADPTCNYSEQNATAKIGERLVQLKYNPAQLGAAKFSKKDCSYSYTYVGSEGKFEFLFSQWGDIHTWDYEAQK